MYVLLDVLLDVPAHGSVDELAHVPVDVSVGMWRRCLQEPGLAPHRDQRYQNVLVC